MIDYTLFGTYNREAICILSKHIDNTFYKKPPEKGWSVPIYSNGTGVKMYVYENGFGEFYKIILAFSPHIQSNHSLHNANFFPYNEAQSQVKKTFNYLGIREYLFKEFYISSIELGVNFPVHFNNDYILNTALMHKGNFFVTHSKFSHYKFAENGKDKYLKVKFYIKSNQRNNDTDLTYHELGYCPNNIMRFEIKLQKIGKFKFFNFSNMESLFAENTGQIFLDELMNRFEEMFFFHTKELKNTNLTKPQLKKYFQYSVNGYWQNLNTRKLKDEKNYYNENMPQKNNIKNELREIILQQFQPKNYVEIPTKIDNKTMSKFPSKFLRKYKAEKPLNRGSEIKFCNPMRYIGMGKTTNFYNFETHNKVICLVTGLDISMQKKGSKFLCVTGLKYYKENQPETYYKLSEKYLTEKQMGECFDRQNYFIAHNIRNTKTNPIHNPMYNRQRFEKRNYNPNQLQFVLI